VVWHGRSLAYPERVFGRTRKAEETTPEVAQEPAQTIDPQAPKGRPTPSRRDAEAARKEARHIPSDPKAAKRAQKDRAKRERSEARAGLMAGDERYLPPRDQGPVRAYIRDYVDSRRRISEYFIFIALGILIAGFIPNPQIQVWISTLWFITTGFVALDMVITLVRLNSKLKERWPDKADRKGGMFYAGMRSLQIRKLRIPPPRVKASFRGENLPE